MSGAPHAGSSGSYGSFDHIDGTHRFKEAVPNGYVEYPVRTRHGGSVFFLNFALAKEMGLLPRDHPEQLNRELSAKILETFSLVIINEYDVIHKTRIRKEDVRPNKFMATRYLQIQHPNKQGKTSGDGRGIWNGEIRHRKVSWDISSSGTGATCLSPAAARENRFFKTGDRRVGYGNGYNTLDEGLSAALMSEIFHKNGIATERTLAIISFKNGTSINVRASRNLLRPAHFFHQLKQGHWQGLKASIDFFAERQIENGDWPEGMGSRSSKKRYRNIAEQMALTFSKVAAQFESEYIFCWLEWDGDNILANGGIIDYGSIRQFGLYHREYRYDDVERFSTNIPEQKAKARYIVQNFAQIRDFILTGKKRNIRHYRNDPVLKLFDRNFKKTLDELLLRKVGFSEAQRTWLMEQHPKLIQQFKRHHSYFEKANSSRGIYKISDGITCDAIFCTRDILRELPRRWLKDSSLLSVRDFIDVIRSSYAAKRDLKVTRYRRKEIRRFQKHWLKLIKKTAAQFTNGKISKLMLEIAMRSSVANRYDRITGDAVLSVTQSLLKNRKQLSFEQKHQIINLVVQHQVLPPTETGESPIQDQVKPNTTIGKLVLRNLKAIRDCREGF